ncbi:MAG: right-handed parallel beta-helix repeat-containing protein [Nitrososphaerales archaeon]
MESFEACTTVKLVFPTIIISAGILLLLLPITVSISTGACISYSSSTQIITISCTAGTRLTDVNNVIHDPTILKKESNGVWTLTANLVVARNANLVIDSIDTSWLKIISSSTKAFGLQNYGTLKIDSVKITSWDAAMNSYASISTDGKTQRAYIVSKSGATGKMDILNSEIAYLGRDVTGEHGLDYYGSDGSLIQNNNIHHNWRAFYSAGVGGITFTKNVIHDNLQYGVDPHSGTHDMYITYNKVYNNNHGIICSVMCYNMHIENNELYNNQKDGIFLDAGSHHSTIANNKIYNEDEGIQLPSLSYSEVFSNTITNSNYGIVIYTQIGSIFDRDDRCGSIGCVSIKNNIHDNTIKVSTAGIVIKGGASGNTISSNFMSGNSQYGIMIDGSTTSANAFRYNHISNSKYGIALNSNKESVFKRNYFDTAVSSGEYTLRSTSSLRLEDTKFYNDIIKALDSSSNQVGISKSGVIDVTDGATSQTTKYFTDSQTFTKTLKNNAIIKINTISSTTLTSSAVLTGMPGPSSLAKDNLTISISKLDINRSTTDASNKPRTDNDNSLSSKSDGANAIALAKNQAQLKAEQSLAQNKGVSYGKSGVLLNNSSKEEQKQIVVQRKVPQTEFVDDNLSTNHHIIKKNKITSMNQYDRHVLYQVVPNKSQEERLKHDTLLTLSIKHGHGDRSYILNGKLLDLNTNGPLKGKEVLVSSYPPLQIPKQKTNKEGIFETALNILTRDLLYKFKGHFTQDSVHYAAKSNTVLLKVENQKFISRPTSSDSDEGFSFRLQAENY